MATELEGRIVGIDIMNPSMQQQEELADAYMEVLQQCREKGGRLVCSPLPYGVKIMRVKDTR